MRCAVIKVDCVATNIAAIQTATAAANYSSACGILAHFAYHQFVVAGYNQACRVNDPKSIFAYIKSFAVHVVGEVGLGQFDLNCFWCFRKRRYCKAFAIKQVRIILG